MAFTVPTTEPTALRAGDTWAWRREDLGDYPASVWTLNYHFRNASSHFDIAATADGDAFAVSVASATTATRPPGWYDWFALVTDGTSRHYVAEGRCEVTPDIANPVPYDGRTWARRMLDYVEAALESRASSDQLDVIEAALDMRKIKRGEGGLSKFRDQLKSEVLAESRAARGVKSNRILAVG
ncbi:MAG: hypothetical protein MUE59_03685 [Thiobacillaceae bacterium]|jgi:hypothetical protein|nr:hypothetical protein [Thiobacillaceae bacterium]